MNKLDFSLHYNKSIVFRDYMGTSTDAENAALIHEMMHRGFVPSDDFRKLLLNNKINVKKLFPELIASLDILTGNSHLHRPMYPNFPKQVAEASEVELFLNAIVHYATLGNWTPEYEAELRACAVETNKKFKTIDVIADPELWDVVYTLIASPDSLTTADKEFIQLSLDNDKLRITDQVAETVVFAETRCILLTELVKRKEKDAFVKLMNNITDVLRVCTYMSDGDISLARNTKFINFKRADRRFFSEVLNDNWDAETAVRHKNKWVKLFHILHVGEYSKSMWRKARALRENEHIPTFNGDIEARLKVMDVEGAIAKLKKRPSEFARRLDHILRLTDSPDYVVSELKTILADIPTKIIIQLIGHFNNRTTERKTVVLPKGQMAKAVLIDQKGELDETVRASVLRELYNSLMKRFTKQDTIEGKVWIDEALKDCPVPSGMRSVTPGLVTVPRGTRFDFGDDNVLRFFVYWKGRDIDLSATYHDEDFNMVGHVSYTKLRDKNVEAYHSGDITSAPHGASEFIDVNVAKGAKKARYVAMNVLVYAGPTFKEHEECFVGWMTRSKPNSNEIYEPSTVKNCIHLVNETTYVCPVIFDLKERKAIFVDMTKNAEKSFGGNNIESNQAGIEDILYSAVNPKKMSLYDLFETHALVRSEGIVENKDEADFIVGVEEGNITPTDWFKIQTDWMS